MMDFRGLRQPGGNAPIQRGQPQYPVGNQIGMPQQRPPMGRFGDIPFQPLPMNIPQYPSSGPGGGASAPRLGQPYQMGTPQWPGMQRNPYQMGQPQWPGMQQEGRNPYQMGIPQYPRMQNPYQMGRPQWPGMQQRQPMMQQQSPWGMPGRY